MQIEPCPNLESEEEEQTLCIGRRSQVRDHLSDLIAAQLERFLLVRTSGHRRRRRRLDWKGWRGPQPVSLMSQPPRASPVGGLQAVRLVGQTVSACRSFLAAAAPCYGPRRG